MAHEDVKRGHVAATVFLAWLARFGEKSFVAGTKICPTTCRMKFSRFEFVLREAGTKWPQLSMSPRAHCSCIRSLHIKGLVPPSRPRDMFSSVCRPLHSWLPQSNHELRQSATLCTATLFYSFGSNSSLFTAKHSRKSFTSVVAYTRFVAAFIVNRVQQVC